MMPRLNPTADDYGEWAGQAAPSRRLPPVVLALAAQAGGKVLKRGHKVFWGGYIGFFEDPDGHLWEVAWNPHFPLAADGSLRLPA